MQQKKGANEGEVFFMCLFFNTNRILTVYSWSMMSIWCLYLNESAISYYSFNYMVGNLKTYFIPELRLGYVKHEEDGGRIA